MQNHFNLLPVIIGFWCAIYLYLPFAFFLLPVSLTWLSLHPLGILISVTRSNLTNLKMWWKQKVFSLDSLLHTWQFPLCVGERWGSKRNAHCFCVWQIRGRMFVWCSVMSQWQPHVILVAVFVIVAVIFIQTIFKLQQFCFKQCLHGYLDIG